MKSNRGARNLLEKMIDLYDLLQKYCFGCIDIFQFVLIPTIVPAGFSHNASQSFVGIGGDILWCNHTVHLMNCKGKMKWKIVIIQTFKCTC